MSFGWSTSNPTGTVGYGWGTGFTGMMSGAPSLQQQQQLQDEAQFNSLFPVAGFVTGEQVKSVFQASGLSSAQLAQIWSSVDKDHDGKINKMEFCSAMAMIRQAKQGSLMNSSLPASSLTGLGGGSGFLASGVGSGTGGSTSGGGAMSKSWSTSAFSAAPPGGLAPVTSGGAATQGWAIRPQEMRKYVMDFNSIDTSKSGFISGMEARTLLTKSGLDKLILAKIWELSDIDKDGRLSCDEYAIAMHLVTRVKSGAPLPSSLPAELFPGPAKYYTVDRMAAKAGKVHPVSLEKKMSVSEQLGSVKPSSPSAVRKTHNRTPSGGHSPSVAGKMAGHARNPSGGGLGHTRNLSGGGGAGDSVTFEDKRKENFEAGRMELERRRRAIKEQQEREAAEKERKKREEEERRLQQERDAEVARQAELERQRRKALEIEAERERQMQRLAERREEEQRERERKRKEEWSRKRRVELEGQRDWERKSLHSLRVQHSQLEDQLRLLDQRKISVEASTERQKSMYSQLVVDIKSMRLSHDVRRAELTKLQSELNGYHTQLSSLQRQRRELREALQGRSPEMSLYQEQRQQLKDKIIGLAASLAGLRSNISYNSTTKDTLMSSYQTNSQLLNDLKQTQKSESTAVSELRQKVLSHQEAFELERREREEREREERKEREERERVMREVEMRARKEARLLKIKQDQEKALNKAKVEDIMAKSKPDQGKGSKPPLPNKPSNLSPTHGPTPAAVRQATPPEVEEWKAEDDEVRKKVQQLQKRKAELQKQRDKKGAAGPSKPTPYLDKKEKGKVSKQELVEKGKQIKPETVDKSKGKVKKGKEVVNQAEQLLDLNSSWDSTAQTSPGISSFAKDTSQILKPLKPVQEEQTEPPSGRKSRSPPPKPLPRSSSVSPEPTSPEETTVRKYSVARLSELFDRGLSPTSVKGWSSSIQPAAPPSPTSPTSQAVSPPQDVAVETKYEVLYDYQAADDAEVTIVEGDVVTFVPRADTSPGWMMVRVASGEEGWVPESYLQLKTESVASQEGVVSQESMGSDEGVAKETGQVMKERESPPEASSSPLPLEAKVLFAWKGSKANHLSLVRGSVVRVLQQSEKWWSGEYQGSVGWFPKTFVKIIDTPEVSQATPTSTAEATPSATHQSDAATPSSPTSPGAGDGGVVLYRAIYDYTGETEGDLTFKEGDVIQVTSSEGEWWTGKLNGKTGAFPSNYVELKQEVSSLAPSSTFQPISPLSPSAPPSLTPSFSAPAATSPLSPSPQTSLSSLQAQPNKPRIARVKVEYASSKSGQLSLKQGELVKVLKDAGNGWLEGELQSRGKKRAVGWFPANRVEFLPQRNQNASSSNSITSPAHSISSTYSYSSAPELRGARAKSPLLEVLGDPSPSPANLVLALYTYNAQSSDELSFHKGSVITVLGKEGEWWKGEVNDKTGLFPSNYVQPLTEQQPSTTEITRWADSVSAEVLNSVSDQERKRQEAIFELLTSERHYVDSLKLVKEVFFDPMIQDQVLEEDDLARVMVNWDELIECATNLLSSFLVRLRTSGEMVRSIGDVLVSQIPNLTPHIRWCGCQLNACLLLQQKASDPKLKEFEQKCSTDARTGGLPLSSFLLKPMQRVTKYPLLIERILDYTSPTDNDYSELKSALGLAKVLCDNVNDGVRQKENTEHLEWLQSHVTSTLLEEKLVFNSQTNFMGSRKILHHGRFFKIRGSKDLVGFLFNDFLLLARPKLFFPKAATPADLEPWGKNEFLMYRKPFLLDEIRVKKSGTDANGAMLTLNQANPEEKDILLRVDTEKARDQWVKLITKASLDFITTKKKIEREKREQQLRTLRDSVGTLEVTVVQGIGLLAKDPNGKSDPFCVIKLGEQQEQKTPVIQNSLNPKWNYKMKFAVHDINKDTLEITVFDKDLFSPNDFLGCGHVSLKDLLGRGDESPWDKVVLLENVTSGEVSLKIALTLNKSNLLL